VVKLGIDDALPTTTSLIFNTVTGNSATGGTIDLNGHNQTVAALSYNAASTAGGSVATNYKITNTGTVDAVFTVNGSTTPTNGFAGVISSGTTNKTSLVKDGTNTLTLSATNTYTGTTSVQGGALIVSGSISASSLTTVSGTGTLGGGGTVGALTVASGGTVSPGSSPGTLNAGATILQSGGRYKLELASDGTGAAGTDWDQLAVTGTLNLSGLSSGARFILKLQTLDSSNANADGSLVSWDGSVNHTWTSIITTTLGVTGFSADKFLVDTSGFANFFPGVFGVVLNGNNLDLQYLAVPEPSAALSLIVGAGTLLGFRRRRIA
jgi:autotransporter-associated beta strand protein